MTARWTDETARLVADAMLAELNAWDGEPDDRAIGMAVTRAVLSALADAGLLSRARTWHEDDPEPDVPAIRDCDHDVWVKVAGGWQHLSDRNGVNLWPWTALREYAPIVETEIPPGSPS